MPRNGSGVYTLPSGINPVVPNTTITSNWANTTLSDLAAAITQSIARDGQTTPVANLPMGGFRHTNVSDPSARNQYASLGWVQDGFAIRLTGVSTGNNITASLIGNTTVLQPGQAVVLIPASNNSGVVTLNINGIGPKPVLRTNGEDFGPNQLTNGHPYLLLYNGVAFIVLNAVIDSGSVTSVNAGVAGGTVATFTGGPITTSGSLLLTFNPNIEGWASVPPANKQDTLGFTPANIAGDTFTGNVTAPNITSTGLVTSNGTFTSSQSNVVLSTTGAGGVFLRPNGAGSDVGQALLDQLGNLRLDGAASTPSASRLVLRTTHASGIPGITFSNASHVFKGGVYWNSPTDSVDFYTSQDGAAPRVRLTGPGRLQTVSGLGVNDTVASGTADLTKHIDLYGGVYGFCITASTLNYVVPSLSKHSFIINSAERAMVDGTGLGDYAPTTGTIVNVRDAPVWYTSSNLNLAQTHRGSALVKADSTARTVTIQPNSSVAIGVGMMVTFANGGGQTNNLTIARGSGVALWRNGTNADIVLAPGHSVTILKIATDVWQA